MPESQIVARRGRRTEEYHPPADLRSKQVEHQRAEKAYNAAIAARGAAARRAHDAGMDWTAIGQILGVGRVRAQEIAHPRATKKAGKK